MKVLRNSLSNHRSGNAGWFVASALVVALLASDLLNVVPAQAQGSGDLIVAPTRVVLEGRTRSAQLSLVNRGSGTATYRISVINMRMSENGDLREIAQPDPGQKFADRLFRYSPRQVTLEPGASQAVRLLLRKPSDLAPGEYRSHILMRAVPNLEGTSVEAPTDGSTTVQLVPVFGIAIPVIVRHGEVDYGIQVSDLTFVPADAENPLPRVRFTLNRSGNRSAFGDLTAVMDNGGDPVVLGQIMRLAVYTPNETRTVEMALRVPEGVSINGQNLTVAFKTIADEGAVMLGDASITLP